MHYPKQKDSQNIIVMDENVKHRGLFSYYLPRIICLLILSGMSAYGMFSIVLHPKIVLFLERLDNARPMEVIVVLLIIASICGVIAWFKYKK
jgi:H+/Cl- antiporter ClcA